jgi:repressor LexA
MSQVNESAERKLYMSLSLRQEKILDFIRRFSNDHGFPPTIREIGQDVGISSTSVVNYNLNVLEKKRYLERDKNVSRGLRLTAVAGQADSPSRDIVRIPVWGRIVAGEPLPVPETGSFPDETVDIAVGMLSDTDDVYALEVDGDSMIDALIHSGDVVLLKHQNYARNGDMVAALLRGEKETTLKRFYLEGKQVRLQPANPTMKPIYAPADDVEIQGKVIMVIRRLN